MDGGDGGRTGDRCGSDESAERRETMGGYRASNERDGRCRDGRSDKECLNGDGGGRGGGGVGEPRGSLLPRRKSEW